MKNIYHVKCYNREAEALKVKAKLEKQKTKLAVEIGHNIQKEILHLEELGFNVYYGRVHIIDVEHLQIVKN